MGGVALIKFPGGLGSAEVSGAGEVFLSVFHYFSGMQFYTVFVDFWYPFGPPFSIIFDDFLIHFGTQILCMFLEGFRTTFGIISDDFSRLFAPLLQKH